MSITADLIRGHTETIILAQLMRGDTYGYEINKTIQQRTGGDKRLVNVARRDDDGTAIAGAPS